MRRRLAAKGIAGVCSELLTCACNLPVQSIVDQGKGYSPRDTESGQLLIDRGKHLDVLEYLLWINRWGCC